MTRATSVGKNRLWSHLTLKTCQNMRKKSFLGIMKIHYKGIKDQFSIVTSDQTHLRFLVTEVFKLVNNFNPHFMWDYFKMNFFPYDLRKVKIRCTFLRHIHLAME